MTFNFEIPADLSESYSCHFGVYVPNGTVALLCALDLLKIPRGGTIAIPSWVCWKVAYAITYSGRHYCEYELDEHLQVRIDENLPLSENIDAALLVHYVGWPCDMDKFRIAFPTKPIIEDCAQAWGLTRSGQNMGFGADVVITSFGPRKALTIGHLGAVMFSHEEWCENFDMRQWIPNHKPLPFATQGPSLKEMNVAREHADKALKIRRQRSTIASDKLRAYDFIPLVPNHESEPSWMRLPVRSSSKDHMNDIISLVERDQVPWQYPIHRRHGVSTSKQSIIQESLLIFLDVRRPHSWWDLQCVHHDSFI